MQIRFFTFLVMMGRLRGWFTCLTVADDKFTLASPIGISNQCLERSGLGYPHLAFLTTPAAIRSIGRYSVKLDLSFAIHRFAQGIDYNARSIHPTGTEHPAGGAHAHPFSDL